jgi:ring-1,2-phenylacetyl-CoA epoxidase subunit PaaE
MAVHFHALKIRSVKKETADCVSVSFDVPAELADAFQFKEGQNITLRKIINGEELRRSYSVCNAPHEGELKVAVKKVEGGIFSAFANESLQAGDVLDVMPPTGKFNAKNTMGNYLAIASGSGITPVISIIKHVLHTQPESTFTLIYGNKSRASIIFFEEIEALKNKFMERFSCVNILSRERTDAALNYGRVNGDKLASMRQLISFSSFNDIYICGPEEMIFSSAAFLESEGVAKSNIHFELFTTPGQAKATKANISLAKESGPKSRITVKLDGRSFDFDLGYDNDNILDAALQQGADLPYACKGGVCCTCRARIVEGEVRMDVNYALEEEELEQGYILTCQSHPLTEKVVVDFDIK